MQPHATHAPGASDGFLPHGFCYLWDPALLWTHFWSDLLIGISYVTISVSLAWLVHRARRDIPFSLAFVAFGLFIITCGGTHFMDVWTLWRPVYWTSAAVKVVTAGASLATAIWMPFLVPRAAATISDARLAREREVETARADALAEQNARLEAQAAELETQRAAAQRLAAELARTNDELRRVAAEAQRQAAELEATYRSAPVGLCVLDEELRFVRINEHLAAINGLPPEEHLGRTVSEVLPALATAESGLRRVIETGEPLVGLELSGETRADPGVVHHWVEEWHPLRDDAGQVIGINVVAVDVTERHRAEAERERLLAELGEREHDLRTILDAIPALAWTARADGFIDWYNARWYEYTGTTTADMAGWGWQSVHDPAVLPEVLERWRASVASGTPFEMTFPLRGADGVFRPFLTRVAPARDADGRVTRWFGTNTDLTAERAARDAAETANRAKGEFLAVVSHELRTPLNAIGGYVELLAMGLHGPVSDAQRNALDRVQAAQRRLLGIINDILNYAKLESGTVAYDLRPVDLAAVVRDTAPFLEPQIAAKGLTFEARLSSEDGAPPAPRVIADDDKLRQVLLNLLSNAVKFTPTGGRIVVDVGVRAGTPDVAYLRVSDTGIGIPRDRQAAIFEPFVQADARFARTHEGVGLGLAISRDLARGMGGDLRVRSVEGEGAVFTVTLPRAS